MSGSATGITAIAGRLRPAAGPVAIRAAAVLLGAGCVIWAALPPVHRGYAGFALTVAIAGVAAGGLRLALTAVPVPEESYLLSAGLRTWHAFLAVVRLVPWEEGALIAIVWLEVLHPARPWHTAVLGAGLIAYLLVTHLAESDASLATLRPQARVLGVGAVLLALGAAAGMLPGAGPGAGSALLRLVAAGALVVAAGLVLPYVARRLPRSGRGDLVGIYKRQANTRIFPGGWRLTKMPARREDGVSRGHLACSGREMANSVKNRYDPSSLVTATARTVPPAGEVTMADHFEASIEAFRDWMPYAGRRKGPATIEQYAASAGRLAAWARLNGRTNFGQLTKAELRAFLGSLHGRGGAAASDAWRSTVWAGVRSPYKYLQDEESVPDIAASIMVGRPAESDRVTHLDRREVSKLLRACRTPKEDAVIAVFLDTGARISEVARLTVADVLVSDLRARHLLVHGKGGKDRAVVIGASTAQALRRYLRWRAKSRYADLDELWLGERGAMRASGLDKLIRDVAARAGLEGVHPHALRHTWSHFYRLDGGSLDNMCYLAGWSGPAMALKYGRSAAAERAEAEARDLSLVDRMRGRS